jgi:UrcA family protein
MASSTLTRLTCIAGALVCLAAALPAPASAPETQRRIAVNYADLNLGSVAGATQLYARIRAAAERVCGASGMTLGEQYAWQVCFQRSVMDAVNAVDNPILTSLAQGRDPREQTALNR